MDIKNIFSSSEEIGKASWMPVLRIILGLIIFMKGVYFALDREAVVEMLAGTPVEYLSIFLVHYIVMAHIAGGILIAFGLITRIAALFQLPVLLGAIIFVNAEQGVFSLHSEMGFALLVFALLVVFFTYGSGKFSVDAYIDEHLPGRQYKGEFKVSE